MNLDDALALVDSLDPDTALALADSCTWAPLPGPQLDAWNSEADELFYGGAAGGGKTDFVCGLALERHYMSVIYRRESPQLGGVTDRMTELLGGRDNFSEGRVWRLGQRQFEYGSMPHIGDETKQQGRPRDLLIFDEVTQFAELQYRYLQTWNRPGPLTPRHHRCRIVATGNPPTTPEGLWVTKYWAPWLDDQHPLYPYPPGKLRYYLTQGGKDTEMEDGLPVEVLGPDGVKRWVRPRSRTFIPAKVEDNPFLMTEGYANTLEGLPEPLRSQMRFGDFRAGQDDHEWQVVPSAWVEAAQMRWRHRQHDNHGPMSAMGMDCARGGADSQVLVPRHGSWFGAPILTPGVEVIDGPAAVSVAVKYLRNRAPLLVDVVGVGSSVVDTANGLGLQVEALNGAKKSFRISKTGHMKFANMRAEHIWRMRELLDPNNPDPVALPPGAEVRADICAPRWKLTAQGVQIEEKEAIKTRIGRSPDIGDAICYSAHDYESMGLMSQEVLAAAKDSHYDGPYRRQESETRHPRDAGHGFVGFTDKIVYPGD